MFITHRIKLAVRYVFLCMSKFYFKTPLKSVCIRRRIGDMFLQNYTNNKIPGEFGMNSPGEFLSYAIIAVSYSANRVAFLALV